MAQETLHSFFLLSQVSFNPEAELRRIHRECPSPAIDINIFSLERRVKEETLTKEFFCIVKNPNGQSKRKKSYSIWDWFTFGKQMEVIECEILQSASKSFPNETLFACSRPRYNLVNSLPDSRNETDLPVESGSNWIQAIRTVEVVALVEACKGFLKYTFKRWFPLHHPQIDLWFARLDTALSVVGTGSLVVTLATSSWNTLPIIALSGFVGFLTSWVCRTFGVGEMIAQFLFYVKDLIFYYISQLLRFFGAPEDVANAFWKDTTLDCHVRVGTCINCETRPRTVVSGNCNHLAYCEVCAMIVHHCPCGEVYGSENRKIVGATIPCLQNCGQCILLPCCACCQKRATVTLVYPNGMASNRCNDHIDSTSLAKISFPFAESYCQNR